LAAYDPAWLGAAAGRYETRAGAASRWLRRSPTLAFYPLFFRAAFRARRRLSAGDDSYTTYMRFCLELVRAFERVGVRMEFSGYGPGEVPAGPFVAVANHMSLMDSIIAAALFCPVRPASAIVTERMLRTPLLGPIVRASGAVAVTGRHPRRDLEKIYAEVVPRVRAGETFLVFPEGRRSAVFAVQRFNSLGIKIARAAAVPLVPIAVRTDAWGIGLRKAYLAPVRIDRPMRVRALRAIQVTRPDQPARARQLHAIAETVAAWGVPVIPHPRPPDWLNDPLTAGRPAKFVRAEWTGVGREARLAGEERKVVDPATAEARRV
jgi:1-acyl-sn-glycerol-3-phosphate acyltransferase